MLERANSITLYIFKSIWRPYLLDKKVRTIIFEKLTSLTVDEPLSFCIAYYNKSLKAFEVEESPIEVETSFHQMMLPI